jgi:hypothetical protein
MSAPRPTARRAATSDEYRGPGPASPWRRCASEGDRGSYPAADRPLVYFFCYESP